MKYYNTSATKFNLITPGGVFALLGTLSGIIGIIAYLFKVFSGIVLNAFQRNLSSSFLHTILYIIISAIVLMTLFFTVAILLKTHQTDSERIKHLIKEALFLTENGNPLKLRDGERLPKIICEEKEKGIFGVRVFTAAPSVEDIQNAVTQISAGLKRKFKEYAVVSSSVDVAFNSVDFVIENVSIDKTIYAETVNDLLSDNITLLRVQNGSNIDLTTSGSILVAGKTRSGKTTGIISLLLQILSQGRDQFDSNVIIIDPKQAELSRLPHVITLDEDGEATTILSTLKEFSQTITKRQRILNQLSEERGDAVKWWDAGMHVSFLFIDEFVALRSVFPKKAEKDAPDYSLLSFDSVLKRIVTMGASAGCYVIVSIAEASVEEGGLPAMLRSAMSTKILFKPTMPEARLIWDSEKLKTIPERIYNPGDAWFSSTDGIHDAVTYVHFPVMKFKVYSELGRLLSQYYS